MDQPINASLEELERWHYAQGNVATAALLAQIIDGYSLPDEESIYQQGWDDGYEAGRGEEKYDV